MSRRSILAAIAGTAAASLVLCRTDEDTERAAAVERIVRRAPSSPVVTESPPVPDLSGLTGDFDVDRPFWAEHGFRQTDSVDRVQALGQAFRDRYPGLPSGWPGTFCAMHTALADLHDPAVAAACAVGLLARFPEDPEAQAFAYSAALTAQDEPLARDIRFATGLGPRLPVFLGDAGLEHDLNRAWGGWLSVHAPSVQRELVGLYGRNAGGSLGTYAAIAGGVAACDWGDIVVCAP
ncbi:MAG: hypothetical protein KC656_00230 [Myxococcales bacterium]|nr:hypothetical protein [Myxococcales bacterium]MCA9566230.1 hypothetical protein [Myxococcales bacterium]